MMSKDRIDSYLLFAATAVSSLFAGLLIRFCWTGIDPIEMDYAIGESRWLTIWSYPVSLISYLGIYALFFRKKYDFLYIGLFSFPVALGLYLSTAQIFGRFLQPSDHQNFREMFFFGLVVGTFVTFILSAMAAGTSYVVKKLIGTASDGSL